MKKMMQSTTGHETLSIVTVFVLLIFLFFSPFLSAKHFKEFGQENNASISSNEIEAHLSKMNKPFVKSIKSPDGDIIDSVLIHLQPAFDLPELKGTIQLVPPEVPKGGENTKMESEIKQLWSSNGESCPEGTIPIRRTSASDISRFGSISKFGKKLGQKSGGQGHEHALGIVAGGEYYGAKGTVNLWAPNVKNDEDYSNSQIWVISSPNQDANVIEAGWMVYPKLTGDRLARLFIYWTSPDGDIIDCVPINLRLAFDLPQSKRRMPLDPPELPNGNDNAEMESEIKQLWSSKGESRPNATIPIRRTTASDILKSVSVSKFGTKFSTENVTTSNGHEHAIAYVMQGEFYGAKARLNVWKPNVVGNDFSLSQIWVISNVPTHDIQTVEAGWQVCPSLYKNNIPRLFNYWTPDGYQSGCYNLQCPGFVQISNKISLGAALDPISTYNGKQYDTPFLIWKDPQGGNWWLRAGSEVIGYWPKTLFTDLSDHATMIEYGGEVYSGNLGTHTSTQMGSGHFSNEGFRKAAYARNLEVVDQTNHFNPVSNLNVLAEKPNCYDVRKGYTNTWGNHIFFGGPGNNPNCP